MLGRAKRISTENIASYLQNAGIVDILSIMIRCIGMAAYVRNVEK